MATLTPMMSQYFEIKKQYAECLLFFRLGDFYEMFFDDALVASKELDITLTGRDCGQAERAPMCGVPYHAADGYISRLIEKGYKVAICEQVEDPKATKGIVKREVVRVVTPGTVVDANMLEEGRNNFLVCIYHDAQGFGLAYTDISTGELTTACFGPGEDKLVLDELFKLAPKEIIVNTIKGLENIGPPIFHVKPTAYSAWFFEHDYGYRKLCTHFGVLHLKGLGLEDKPLCVCACGALFEYLQETHKNALNHILAINITQQGATLMLDAASRRNLELTEGMGGRGKKGTLLWVLNKTKTAMGARLLRQWVEEPLRQVADINRRLDAVEAYKNDGLTRAELAELLGGIYDFERTAAKVAYKTANARDLLVLKNSFAKFPAIHSMINAFTPALCREMANNFDTLQDIYTLIDTHICEEPPISTQEGGMFRAGVNEELDRFIEAKNQGTSWLLALENREKEKTGIKNLKVRFNKVFGYYIEVTNSYKNLVPPHYVRRQTLANCERFITDELKKIEDTLLGAEEKMAGLESRLFAQLLETISREMPRIQYAAHMIATADVLQSLAEVAEKYRYTKPEMATDGAIRIDGGRHPVIERLSDAPFVPNNTLLDLQGNRLSIITGPNMAGKSTFMRQTGLIVLMAQMGSFIPAEYGHISVVDRIFTRVGASDDLATGQSTFMVEMTEVANILNHATQNSLIILDEIGRGTSTYDGLSIAWAVLEYIAAKIGAKTLFATHYHELTELEGKVEGVNNYCVLVQEQGADIIFLRKIARGGAGGSYGIHVAKLAGVPPVVLSRADAILNALNQADIAKTPPPTSPHTGDEVVYYGKQKTKSPEEEIIIKELQQLDVDALTPREALRVLYELQQASKGK